MPELSMLEYCNIEQIPFDVEQFSEGKYPGRTISFISSPKEDALIVRYEISGRSTGSRSRIMSFHGPHNVPFKRRYVQGDDYWLKTEPLHNPTEDDILNRNYEAARILGNKFVVLSNGHQTDNLVSRINDAIYSDREIEDMASYLKLALMTTKPETDIGGKFGTARIAGVARRVADADFELALGSIDRRIDENGFNVHMRRTFTERLSPGEGISVSTYNPNTPWMDYPSYDKVNVYGSFNDIVKKDWEEVSKNTVTERKTGNIIPTRTSVAWMYIPFDTGKRGTLLVKNEFTKQKV